MRTIPDTAVVTGCSSGIGRALVDAFLERDWFVIATGRQLSRRAGELGFRPSDNLQIVDLDVTSHPQRDRVGEIVEQHGRLDCLINNAGFALFGAFADIEPEQFRSQLETNLFAPVFLTRRLLPALRASRGTVVNVSSWMGFHGLPSNSAYCASKWALAGVSESLHHELAPEIRVLLCELSGFRTNFADSAQWAAGTSPEYSQRTVAHRRFLARLKQRPGVSPRLAARAILDLVESDTRCLRHRIGLQAQLLGWLCLLPQAWRAALLRRLVAKTLFAPEVA